MPYQTFDAYGHEAPQSNGTAAALVAGAVSTSAVGTIAGTAAAGAAPTITAVSAVDMAGNFVLNPVTGGGAQAAGSVVLVTFAEPMSAIPKSVVVNMCDNAAGASQIAIAVSAQNVTTNGFNINVAAALTTAHNYFTTYAVTP